MTLLLGPISKQTGTYTENIVQKPFNGLKRTSHKDKQNKDLAIAGAYSIQAR